MRLSANSYEIERQAKGSDEWSFASTVAVLSANRIHSSGLTSAESQVVWDTLVSIGTLSNLGY
jgi:hypothetical protein